MGFFNNMLPVRLPVNTPLRWIDWIAQVRAAVVAAFAHQDVPFERIAHELEAEQPGVHAQLYQCMFSFQDTRDRPTRWGPLAHERVHVRHRDATEDLNLWLVEIPSGIEGGVQYDTHLYLPDTARALHHRFAALLEAVANSPEQTVAQLIAPTETEQAAVLALDAAMPARVESLFELLESRARSAGDAPLLRSASQQFGARELAQRVNDSVGKLKTRWPASGHLNACACATDGPAKTSRLRSRPRVRGAASRRRAAARCHGAERRRCVPTSQRPGPSSTSGL
jgi:non-ribosomal peptide synthetase component F